MKVLVIDVGGTHVKLLASGQDEPRQYDSGKTHTPDEMVANVRELTADWEYDAISLGVPATVGANGPTAEPGNLGDGWVGFDYSAAFGRPVRVANDAAMQALGAYESGRMLFLGLGTGLGSALVAERVVIPLELGRLRFDDGESFGDRLGKVGYERLGPEAWGRYVAIAANVLREAFVADHLVLGGGHADVVDPLPEHCRRGGNADAFTGGFRLWEEFVEPHDRPPPGVWRVIG